MGVGLSLCHTQGLLLHRGREGWPLAVVSRGAGALLLEHCLAHFMLRAL